jgi:putative N6-adenine-specific DNA methylase
MALNIPPGLNRRFAFMDWPNFDESLWKSICAEVQPSTSNFPTVFAADRDAGAIKMARENAARAGVAEFIRFECQAISGLQRLQSLAPKSACPGGQARGDFGVRETGWVVTNPPYGLRVSEGKDLRNLYAQFGNVLRAACPGWQVAVLSSDLILLGQMGIKLDTSLALVNGGVRARLGRGVVA